MRKIYGMGLDAGNSLTKGVVFIGEESRILSLPSVSTNGSLMKLANDRSAAGDVEFDNPADVLESGEYVLAYDGHEKYMGKLAMKEDPRASSGRSDPNRYWNKRIIESALTIAGTLIPEDDFDLYVVTGLPGQTYSPETIQKVIDNLQGFHEFVLNGRKRMANIIVSKVLQEGAGASIAMATQSPGLQGFIDPGGYSTELYVCDQKVHAVSNLCAAISLGVENIADEIDRRYREHYSIDVPLTSQERYDILRAYAAPLKVAYPMIYVGGPIVNPLHLRTWAHESVVLVGGQINEFIAKHWKTGERGRVAFNFAAVYLLGGGYYYLENEIKKIIPAVQHPARPELQNVLGYAMFARRIAAKAEAVA